MHSTSLSNLFSAHRYSFFAVGVGCGVYLFLLIIGPFDSQPLSFGWRAQLMLGYGVIATVACWMADLLLRRLPARFLPANWWVRQLCFLVLFYLLNFWPTYAYYISDLVQGTWTFTRFLLEIYLASALILTIAILPARFIMLNKVGDQNQPSTITIKGENKLDVLRLAPENLLYVKTAANYVEVHYYVAAVAHKRLLRTTLKRVASAHPFLLRVHRSYLVNMDCVTGWRSPKVLLVGNTSIPVSDTYRPEVISTLETRPRDAVFRP